MSEPSVSARACDTATPPAPARPAAASNWLHRFAAATALATLGLIGLGGLVTSHGVGMAVPDWPTTYGYNMFLFPVSQWVGGIFYEHTHRLAASVVGFLTTILALWIWRAEERRWLQWLGLAAFVGVFAQGVLGGLRVTLFKDQIGIVHATLAQLFLVLVSLIALFTSPTWRRAPAIEQSIASGSTHAWALRAGLLSLLLLAQLVLGATMRHQHAGLAIPDFPLAHGSLWPATDDAALARFNQQRVDARDFRPITATDVHSHMAHRIVAVVIVLGAALFARRAVQRHGWRSVPARIGSVWLSLILLQAILGAVTVWSNKAADVATLHVVLGATTLVWGALGTAWLARPRTETKAAGQPHPDVVDWLEPRIPGRHDAVSAR